MSLLSSFDNFPLSFEKAEIKTEKRSYIGVFIHVNSEKFEKVFSGHKWIPEELFVTEKWQVYTDDRGSRQISQILLNCNDKSVLLNIDLLYSSVPEHIDDYIFDPIAGLIVPLKYRKK